MKWRKTSPMANYEAAAATITAAGGAFVPPALPDREVRLMRTNRGIRGFIHVGDNEPEPGNGWRYGWRDFSGVFGAGGAGIWIQDFKPTSHLVHPQLRVARTPENVRTGEPWQYFVKHDDGWRPVRTRAAIEYLTNTGVRNAVEFLKAARSRVMQRNELCHSC